jgi:hypothetical protein
MAIGKGWRSILALLELFIGGRERCEAKKADLIAQLGSRVKDVEIAAADFTSKPATWR